VQISCKAARILAGARELYSPALNEPWWGSARRGGTEKSQCIAPQTGRKLPHGSTQAGMSCSCSRSTVTPNLQRRHSRSRPQDVRIVHSFLWTPTYLASYTSTPHQWALLSIQTFSQFAAQTRSICCYASGRHIGAIERSATGAKRHRQPVPIHRAQRNMRSNRVRQRSIRCAADFIITSAIRLV
jgi:hypothetical protein